MKPKVFYIDMDGVLCDFEGAFSRDKIAYPDNPYPQSRKGFYRELKPISGAVKAMEMLLAAEAVEAYILTAPSVHNPLSYTEKRLWVEEYLGFEWVNKLIMSPDKSLLKGDVLIDDHIAGRGQDLFDGILFQFGSPEFENWTAVTQAINQFNTNL